MVQKHNASCAELHWLRLEHGGVLWNWGRAQGVPRSIRPIDGSPGGAPRLVTPALPERISGRRITQFPQLRRPRMPTDSPRQRARELRQRAERHRLLAKQIGDEPRR